MAECCTTNRDWPIITKVIDSLHLNTSIIIFSMQMEEHIIKYIYQATHIYLILVKSLRETFWSDP